MRERLFCASWETRRLVELKASLSASWKAARVFTDTENGALATQATRPMKLRSSSSAQLHCRREDAQTAIPVRPVDARAAEGRSLQWRLTSASEAARLCSGVKTPQCFLQNPRFAVAR